MNDYEAEELAHAVSNSDDLCLPSDPVRALNDMQRAVGQTSGTVAVSSYKTVNLKGYKLGQDGRIVKGRKPKIERNQRVIRFYEAGIEPKQISEWLEISVQQVHKIIRRGY